MTFLLFYITGAAFTAGMIHSKADEYIKEKDVNDDFNPLVFKALLLMCWPPVLGEHLERKWD